MFIRGYVSLRSREKISAPVRGVQHHVLGKECLRFCCGWLCFDQKEKWGNGALDISLLLLGRRRALRGQMESVVSIHKEYHCKLRDLRVFCTSRRASAICLYIFLCFAHREGHLRFAYIYSCVLHIEKDICDLLIYIPAFCTSRRAL